MTKTIKVILEVTIKGGKVIDVYVVRKKRACCPLFACG